MFLDQPRTPSPWLLSNQPPLPAISTLPLSLTPTTAAVAASTWATTTSCPFARPEGSLVPIPTRPLGAKVVTLSQAPAAAPCLKICRLPGPSDPTCSSHD